MFIFRITPEILEKSIFGDWQKFKNSKDIKKRGVAPTMHFFSYYIDNYGKNNSNI